MRTFILFARKAKTSPEFNIEDLPSSGGRMDLVARCISSAIFISYAIRKDTRIFIVLNGPPDPPITICFDGQITNVSPDERSIALWIQKVLSLKIDKGWKRTRNGILIARKSFQELIKELAKDSSFYILHEKGKKTKKIKKNPVFIIGDHLDLLPKEKKFALRYGEKLSLGKTSYLASSCISILHWVCDRERV